MSQLFKTQTDLSIILDTGRDVTTATVKRIIYFKPNGDTGQWTASLSGTNKLLYNVVNGEIDIEGTWKFQSYVEISGLKSYGEIVSQFFDSPIKVQI